ncbi:GGDEF domain-containing protein [Marinomonas atlantica]|uniref:GGDEF domain-containing protein n=1 Tax=Marinomonas atlantica TaxID=1806668 RepID=UPI0008338214|nr:diguanylate cyclase [Marinomonas atlantica]
MSPNGLFTIPRLQKLGIRLNLILLGIILFFLVSSGYGIWVLQQQSAQFKTITQTYYDRAMLAAELSRDAELIATKAMEQTVTQRLSSIDANILQSDITRTFTAARERLAAKAPEEQAVLARIDSLTQPYFNQLTTFYTLIEQQQRLKQKMDILSFDRVKLTTPYLPEFKAIDIEPFDALITSASNVTLLLLDAHSPGLIARRDSHISDTIDALLSISTLNKSQKRDRDALILNINQTRELKEQLDQSRLETLAAMRKTRLQAQRLSSVCFDFYLLVKKRAQSASQKHSQLIEQVTLQMALFSIAFLGLIGVAYWLIQHYIVRRLNRLSFVMRQHAIGHPERIPEDGNDEITVISKTFAQFVQANDHAQDEAQRAKKVAEEANERLRELNATLHQQSNTDELTQIPNRRSFFHWLNIIGPELVAKRQSLSIFMIDIDWFKSYNDHYGHQAGDVCLHQVAQLLRGVTKESSGLLARYGGEEFIVAIPDRSPEQANAFGQTILDVIEHAHIPHGYSPRHHITVSIGISTAYEGCVDHSCEKLISKADQALYEAKALGRASVVSNIMKDTL